MTEQPHAIVRSAAVAPQPWANGGGTTRELLRADDDARGRHAYQLADAFCDQSRLRVQALFAALWTNTDASDSRLARSVMAGDYTWLEEGVLDPSEGTGPWIARWEPGASSAESVWRAVR